MNQIEYDTLKRRYSHRQRYAERMKETEDNLPYSVSFRIRLILCLGLFLFFLLAEKNVLTVTEKEKIFTALEQSVTLYNWKENAIDTFSSIKNIIDN